MLSIVEDRLPSVPALARTLPKGLVKIVVMLLVVTVIGALLADANSDSPDFLANSFVILSIPGFVLSLAALVVRDADEPEMDWPRRLAGVVVLAFGVLLSLGMVP
jgi:peptidoglycan/LPS O-acetylase OafA/YrhL